jgi:hypothetical protein
MAEERDFEQRVFAPKVHRQAHRPFAQHGCWKIPIAGVWVNNGHTLQRRKTLKANTPPNEFEDPSGPNMTFELDRKRARN